MLGGNIPRNVGLIVPNVHAGKEMYFPIPIEQPDTQVQFFRAILARARHIKSALADSGDPKNVSASNKHVSGAGLGPHVCFLPIGAKNVECRGGYGWMCFHVPDCDTDFVVVQEPGVVVQTDEKVGIALSHKMIPRLQIAARSLPMNPTNRGIQELQSGSIVFGSIVQYRDLKPGISLA
jgi:hypothetical protein